MRSSATENQQFLWGILEADAKAKKRTPVQQKVGDYFAACMNTAAIDALGAKPVAGRACAKIDALKTRAELIAAISALHHEYAGSFFFGSGTGQDALDCFADDCASWARAGLGCRIATTI